MATAFPNPGDEKTGGAEVRPPGSLRLRVFAFEIRWWHGQTLGRPKFSDGDRERLRKALDSGESWHAVSKKTRIPYATVKKHARAMGYEPRRRPPASELENPRGGRP
jgi:hypothetical protein